MRMLGKIKDNLVIQKILSVTLVLVWMITVFIFSSQDGKETLNTSGAFIYAIDSKLSSSNEPKVEKENRNIEQSSKSDISENNKYKYKYEYSANVQKIVRKNAHYFLYMIGGVILSVFFCVNSIKRVNKNKSNEKEIAIIKKDKTIFYAIIVGIIYAFTDEFHQKFVPGRTSSLKDVLVDSLGVITGGIIIKIFKLLYGKRKDKIFKMGE